MLPFLDARGVGRGGHRQRFRRHRHGHQAQASPGGDDFVILEKDDDLGGTWRDNTYPGCACDVPSHAVLVLLRAEPATGRRIFSPQPEIWDYLRDVRRPRTASRRHIRYGSEVTAARCDEATGTLDGRGRRRRRARAAGAGRRRRRAARAERPRRCPGLDDVRGHGASTPPAGTTTTTSTGERVAVDRHRRQRDPVRARRSSPRSSG